MSHPEAVGALAVDARASRFAAAESPRIATARAIVARTLERFPGRVAVSVSFGGASGAVLLDLVMAADRDVRVFYADTELLFPETYALVGRVEARYGIVVDAVKPKLSVDEQALAHGDALWARDPDACCGLRKVEPLQRYLAGVDAWMSAVRRDQSSTRAGLAVESWDARYGVVKVAPLADWTGDDVWAYVAEHDLPVNTLLFDGYPSLGCVHCTVRPQPGAADERAGRWAGFAKTECGIHE